MQRGLLSSGRKRAKTADDEDSTGAVVRGPPDATHDHTETGLALVTEGAQEKLQARS